MNDCLIRPIAHIESDFTTKFGIPRQAGIAETLEANIVFEKEFRNPDALRGIEAFSHLWLIWQFSEAVRNEWSPTVRPPRLGGNVRMGVFATRSPFRPNSLGLSCVKLVKVDYDAPDGPVITVSGADMMSGTPIFDIKPYIPYADCRADALSGFAPDAGDKLNVVIPPELMTAVKEDKRAALIGVLENDPRPRYHKDAQRVYAMDFAGMTVRFTGDGDTITVIGIE